MRSTSGSTLARSLALLALAGGVARAEPILEEPNGGAMPDELRAALRDAMIEEVELGGSKGPGKALSPRPAAVAEAKLRELAARFPVSAAVQKYLGRLALEAGDVSGAEAAFRQMATLAGPAPWALLQLADFHSDRNQPRDELAALDRLAAAQKPGAVGAGATPDGRTALRATWQRARDTAAAHAGLPGVPDPLRYDRAIVELSPDDPSWLRRYLDGLLADQKLDRALAETAREKKLFPTEARYLAQVEAQIAEARHKPELAEAVYRTLLAGDPVPPAPAAGEAARDTDGIYDDYLDLLRRNGHEREVRRALSARSRAGRLGGFELALLVHLHLHAGDRDRARKVLDTAASDERVPPAEQILRAKLYAALGAPGDAVPILYRAILRASTPRDKEEAVGTLGLALLAGDLGRTGLTPLGPLDGFRLRHLASGPSVAGGLASLLFAGHTGRRGGAAEDDLARVEAAYGNGARAAAAYAELRRIAPSSRFAPGLLRGLVELRRAYRDDAEAARLADEFLRSFPKHAQYFNVGRDGCDSRFRGRGASAHGDGAACYQRLLDEAARRGDSREYDATLRAVTSAWEGAKRGVDVLRLFWSEIAKHPADPALYERLLEHAGRHNLFDEELKVYEEGVKRFGSATWYDRLARWHLRRKGEQAFRGLTERLLTQFDDEVANSYLDQLVEYRHDDETAKTFYEAMYRQALDRFPLDLRFARKLIGFYDRNGRPGAAALVARYSFFDRELRERLLREAAAKGQLEGMLARLRTPDGAGSSPSSAASRQLASSGLVFLSRQEEADPPLASLRRDFPGDAALARRHAALWRAIAQPSARLAAAQAANLLDAVARVHPADESLSSEAGDYLAEAGRFDDALKFYGRIVQLRPGDPEAYLRLASIDWDYFHFDAAADAIQRARKRSGDPLRFADKLAAIYESRKDRPAAIAEYVRIAVAAEQLDGSRGGGSPVTDEVRSWDGEEEEGPGRSGSHADAAPAALSRLGYLSRAHQAGPTIAGEFRARIGPSGGAGAQVDGRAVMAYASFLGSTGDVKGRRALLAQEAGRASDPRLLERIAEAVRGEPEARPVLIAALRREADLGRGAPGYVYPLVDALADAGQDAEAEKELAALAARMDAGGPDDRADAADVYLSWSDFLAKRRRWSDAIARRATAADRAEGDRAIDLRLEVIDWQARHGGIDSAEQGARALLDGAASSGPAEVRLVGALASVMWRRGTPASRDAALAILLARIERTLARKDLDASARQSRVAELRHLAIDRFEAAGRTSEGLDQWIEIVNRHPEERSELLAAQAWAAAHGLTRRLTEYYAKTARAAPRDHRWPVVLSVLADADGDPAAAAAHLGEALAIAPERLDLLGTRAETLARAGDPAGAAAVWHRLWEQTDHDPRHAASEATMLARAGLRAEAIEAVKRIIDGESPDPGPWFRGAAVLERAGLIEDALDLAARGIDRGRRDLRGRSLSREEVASYARLATQAGHAIDAWRALAVLEDKAHADAAAEGNPEPWRASTTADACHDAIDDALPKAIASFATDEAGRAWEREVRERAKDEESIERMIRLADAAGRADLGRELLRKGVALGGSTGDGFASRLLRSLEEAGQWEALAAMARDPASPAGATREGLLSAAHACRVLRDDCERLALQRYTEMPPSRGADPLELRFAERDPAVTRYVDLLLSRHDEAALTALAERGTFQAAQIADLLYARGRPELGDRALQALGRPESALWRATKQASALLALAATGAGDARPRDLLAAALAPSPIGAALGRKPDPEKQLIGRPWFRYGERYADALARAGQPAEGRRWAASPVEDRPLDPVAYVEQGDTLARIADSAGAQAAYERALSLKRTNARAIDHLARVVLAAGDRKAALAIWDRLLGKQPGDASQRARFEAVFAAGLPDQARAAYGDWLASRWSAREPGARLGDLGALAAAFPSRGPSSEWERYLRGLLDRSAWKDSALLAAMAGRADGDPEPLLDPAAREPYLRAGMALASDGATWREALARWGLEQRHYDATLDAVTGLAQGLGDAPLPRWAALARARARAGKGDAKRAADELMAWTKSETTNPAEPGTDAGADRLAAAEVLHELGAPGEWEVRLAYHRARVEASGGPGAAGVADVAGLADGLLHTGRSDEGAALLRRLSLRQLDDEHAARLAAETAERWKLAPLARDIRRRLAVSLPCDGDSRVALARDEALAGEAGAAIARLEAVLADGRTSSAARRAAGRLLGEMARRKQAGAAGAIGRAVARAPRAEESSLASALASNDAAPLVPALETAFAPRAALIELIERESRRGRHAEAAAHLRRLRSLGPDPTGPSPDQLDPALRRREFDEERAAGHPEAALAALADPFRERLDALAEEGAGGANGLRRALASLVRDRLRELGQPGGQSAPDGEAIPRTVEAAALAEHQATAAIAAADRAPAAFYAALAQALAPSAAHARSAEETLAALAASSAVTSRHFVTAALDDLSVLPQPVQGGLRVGAETAGGAR